MGTVLKMLLTERHLSSHSEFLVAYDRHAAQLEPPEPPGNGPSKSQFYNWLSGAVKGLPHNFHRRVLASMFPDWSITELFEMADSPGTSVQLTSNIQTDDGIVEGFLGAEMVAGGVTLVVPTFELAKSTLETLELAGVPRQKVFSKPESVFSAQRRIDAPITLAESDIRGTSYVMSMLAQHQGISVNIQSDRETVAECDRPYISFGLSSNDCTHMYLQNAEDPLFTIQDIPTSNDPYLEFLELADGKRYNSNDERSIGIIARTQPDRDLHPDRYWFYCAGFGPRGTTGASWYMSRYWNTLYDRTGDREFIAIVSVQPYSDQAVSLEHMLVR